MTWRSRIFSLFPTVFLLLALACLVWLLLAPGMLPLLCLLAHLYLLPMLCYRLHQYCWPVREGVSRLDLPDTYVPWWGGHMCQLPYDALPQLEACLRLVPGLYSLWLRGWGARIGRQVYWTPLVEITDRAMLDIGDYAVIGHKAGFYAHVVSRKNNGELRLYVRRIRLGSGALIGAGSRFGPGARVAAGAQLNALTDRWAGGRPPQQDAE
ncbi:acyltransferase [Chitinimonas sp. JJ19]|uniref:acyltransferase n=1 Tax=Chitinimonas sp. JJ19 TaxID=3109352 RepID=UPI002FFF6854